MEDEMLSLEHNCTWDLVYLPEGKHVIRCKWVYIVKVNPDGSLALFVVKWYA